MKNDDFSLVLIVFFEGSREPWGRQPGFQASESDRPGGGKGEGKPSPIRACLEVLETGSKHLHAQRPETSADFVRASAVNGNFFAQNASTWQPSHEKCDTMGTFAPKVRMLWAMGRPCTAEPIFIRGFSLKAEGKMAAWLVSYGKK